MNTEINPSQSNKDIPQESKPDLQALLQENIRLQKKSLDLLYTMKRMQAVRFAVSVIIILLPIIAAFVVLPGFITNTIHDFTALTNTTEKENTTDSER